MRDYNISEEPGSVLVTELTQFRARDIQRASDLS